MSPSQRHFVTTALLLANAGCCTMARLFCGPEQDRWVSVGFTTHRAALDTLLEAIRRDNSDVVFRCLSEDFKRRWQVLGRVEAAVVWERLKDEVTGIHLLGYADVHGPELPADSRARYVLEVAGHRIGVELVRQAYWEVVREDADGPFEDGEYVRDLAPYLSIRPSEDQRSVQVLVAPPPLDPPLDTAALVRVGVGTEWKVDAIERLPE
jgi:hypothetical protein